MTNMVYILLVMLLSTTSYLRSETFGYISHSTINIGDDIQSIAAKRFLPDDAVMVDREFISEFSFPTKVHTVVSGWFMHHKGGYWDLIPPPPSVSWPPSSAIEPFFISIHLTGSFLPMVFSDENIEYLRDHAPIGARDLYTLAQLEKHDVDSYFSGCLTLTLENDCTERNNILYLVDLDEEEVKFIKSKTNLPVITLTHGKPLLRLLKEEHRLKYAQKILDQYKKCRCVVTTRLHAAMPCLAFGTPVLMISSYAKTNVDSRFEGLCQLANHCSREELLSGEYEYDFNYPPPNPTKHLAIREDLIQRMTNWVKKVKDEANQEL